MGKKKNKKKSKVESDESLNNENKNYSKTSAGTKKKKDLIPEAQKQSKNSLKKLKKKKKDVEIKEIQLEEQRTEEMLNMEDEVESNSGQELETDQKTEQMNIEQDVSLEAFLWLLVFSVLMFTFPFVAFYGVHSWLQESFHMSHFQVNCYSVLASVVVVNFIIMLFVYKAFKEDCRPPEEKLKKN